MGKNALDNAHAAVGQLSAFLALPVANDRDRAGVIQAFEFSFETVWRALKHAVEQEGLTAPSPKKALSAAYRLGIIGDEGLWLDMLRDRNLTSHVYNPTIAAQIFSAIASRYAVALAQAVDALRAAGKSP